LRHFSDPSRVEERTVLAQQRSPQARFSLTLTLTLALALALTLYAFGRR